MAEGGSPWRAWSIRGARAEGRNASTERTAARNQSGWRIIMIRFADVVVVDLAACRLLADVAPLADPGYEMLESG